MTGFVHLEHLAAVETVQNGTQVICLLDLAFTASNDVLQVRAHL